MDPSVLLAVTYVKKPLRPIREVRAARRPRMCRQVDRGHSCGSKSHSGWHCPDGAKHRRRLQPASVQFKRSVPSEKGALNLE